MRHIVAETFPTVVIVSIMIMIIIVMICSRRVDGC